MRKMKFNNSDYIISRKQINYNHELLEQINNSITNDGKSGKLSKKVLDYLGLYDI
jgi:hypothetical protein